MGDLRFDDRVAVVTGAGAGLGRAYALLFASRGAKVVVNDLGGGRHGDGSSSKAADAVVEEIRQNGGTAVADYNSVVEGEKIIKTALDNFGRVDILINNAGILRDKSFARISDQDWDLVHAVHLKGSFKTTQAAFPIFKKQNYGRIIMTASNSGLYGNFGQANYSAAKMGLVGLSNTVAIEGSRNNIHCNVIVPTAASRLTEDIIPPELFAELKPELIAPVVAYLCHETCSENGTIIEAAAGWAGKCHLIRSNGSILRSKITDGVSVENVAENWERVTDMSKAEHLNTIQEATLALVSSLDSLRSSKGVDVSEGNPVSFSSKDTILYALGVGASTENPNELKYLYENHEDFTALPTFYILPAMQAIFTSDATQNIIPGRTISLDQVLHGEHYIEFVGDVPTEGKLISKSSVAEVLDKGSGAAIVHNVESFNEDGELVVKNQCVVFAVGAGNFGGPRNGTQIVPCVPVPKRKPDLTLTQRTSVDQAALYRLSGDLNPLHIDPNFSIVAGYETPILHGLCTLGFSVRLVLKGYANYDAKLVNSIKARFVKPVIPGQTLKVDMWQDGNRIHFETSVVETGKIVISATDYCALCPGGTHILCKYKEGISRNCIDYSGSDITPNIKANIVDLHNSLRNKVALGMEDRGLPGPQPAASNMLLLKWDDELALIAQRLADQCTGYNFNNFQDECKITDRFDVGQNVISVVNEYSMKPNFTYMIYVWYNQVENFNRLKVDNLRGLTVNATSVGYYTQLIWAKTEYVGCGHSSFLGNTSIHGGPVDEYLIHRFICNYGPSGNKIGAAVYKRGLPCASCLECDKKYTGLCTKLKPDTRKHFHHFYGNRPRGTTLTAQISTTIGAFVQLKSVSKMQIVPNKLAALELESDAIFEYIADQLKQDPSKGKSVNGIFLYKITKNGKQAKQWTMDLKAGVVYEGEPKEKPNTTLTISDEDFMLLATNKLNPQVAFMKGKLKVTGNVMLAQKLGPLLKANSKL